MPQNSGRNTLNGTTTGTGGFPHNGRASAAAAAPNYHSQQAQHYPQQQQQQHPHHPQPPPYHHPHQNHHGNHNEHHQPQQRHHQHHHHHNPSRSNTGRSSSRSYNQPGGGDAGILRSGGMMNGNNGPPLLDDVVGNVLMNDDSNGVVLHGNEGSAGVSQPTPMFERLVTEEVQELKTYVRIVENQNRRLAELEKVQSDLENRLEIESVCRQHLEATLETREREWAEKIEHVESDRDQWKHLVEVEKLKNSKLIDQVVRKDQDIHRMLQRKYDHESVRSVRGVRASDNEMLKSVRMSRNTDNDVARSIRSNNLRSSGNDHTSSGSNEISRSIRSSLARPNIPSERRSHVQSSPGSVGGGGGGGSSLAKSSSKSPEGGRAAESSGTHKGPYFFLAAAGSVDDVRHRNVNSLLLDFFGI